MCLLRQSAFPETPLFRGLSRADIAFGHGARTRILPQFLLRLKRKRKRRISLPAAEIFRRRRHSLKQ